MNERIRKIRLSQNLTQKQMSEIIGVTEATVSRMESGKSSITEQTIKIICREFNVNKDWILTGEGEMYIASKEDEKLAEALAEISLSGNDRLKELIQKMIELDDIYIDSILNLIDGVLEKQNNKK